MRYWVYESLSYEHTAMIHEEDCRYCNYGQGVKEGQADAAYGQWHGPFRDCGEAEEFAKALPECEVHRCKVCTPKGTAGTDARVRKPFKGFGRNFWVYESLQFDHTATIHDHACRFCNDGAGVKEGKAEKDSGLWHGGFATYEEAKRFAQSLEECREVSDCKVCEPGAATADVITPVTDVETAADVAPVADVTPVADVATAADGSRITIGDKTYTRYVGTGRHLWVYEALAYDRTATIHDHACRYCNDGAGVKDGKADQEYGLWHGGFDTYGEARRFADTLAETTEVKDCKVCSPAPQKSRWWLWLLLLLLLALLLFFLMRGCKATSVPAVAPSVAASVEIPAASVEIPESSAPALAASTPEASIPATSAPEASVPEQSFPEVSAAPVAPAPGGTLKAQLGEATDEVRLYLREGAGTEFTTAGVFAKGEKILLLTRTGEWYQVYGKTVDGGQKLGYSYNDLITPVGDAVDTGMPPRQAEAYGNVAFVSANAVTVSGVAIKPAANVTVKTITGTTLANAGVSDIAVGDSILVWKNVAGEAEYILISRL